MKCVRSVCKNKLARLVSMGELGTAVLGCTHDPVRGFAYCKVCLESCALRGSAGTEACDLMAVPSPAPPPTNPSETAAEECARHRNVFMMEDVLAAEKQTIIRGGEAHRKCM